MVKTVIRVLAPYLLAVLTVSIVLSLSTGYLLEENSTLWNPDVPNWDTWTQIRLVASAFIAWLLGGLIVGFSVPTRPVIAATLLAAALSIPFAGWGAIDFSSDGRGNALSTGYLVVIGQVAGSFAGAVIGALLGRGLRWRTRVENE